jgi:translation initiation factor IF-2
MSIRVHELAKHCGISNAEMMAKLKGLNYPVKSVSSTIDKITAESIEKEYGYTPAAPAPVTPPPAPEPVVAAAPVAPPPPPPPPVAAPVPAPVPVAPRVVPAMVPPKYAMPKITFAPKPAAPPPKKVAPVTPPPAPVKAAVSRPVPPAPQKAVPPPAIAVPPTPPPPPFIIDENGNKVIQMKPPVVVRELAQRVGVKSHLLLADLMQLNVFATLNDTVGEDVARKICERRGFLFQLERRGTGGGTAHQVKPAKIEEGEKVEDLKHRPPIVTVMGHVDHGKTSLLDAIRQTDVATHESGGITQHIGASVVRLPDGKQITFLDTPGHQAFTKMRARGANVTDIAILVVAADDGVMPQTLEALNHAKAAKVTIIVAVNKCDLPAANPDRVKKQLQEQGLQPESWGGDTIMVDVSATTKKNLDQLLEMVLLQAEMLELKANPSGPAKGNVVEAQMEPGMGPTATVLVRKGTLKVGDALVCGPHLAKVRGLIDDKGKRVKEAGPSAPVKIIGFSGMPEAGAEFHVMKNEKEAREVAEQRALDERALAAADVGGARRGTKLEDLLSQLQEGEKKKLNVVLKADVQGSLEAIHDSLSKLKSEKIELQLIHEAVGNITENDVLLASASDAIIIGFRVKVESGVTDIAKREDTQIKLYSIIYELLEQVEEAMKGLLEPEAKETVIGRAEVRQIFQLSKGPAVAGCVVNTGRIARTGRVRVLRRKAVQFEGRIASLRHFQDDVKEVKAGTECGIRLDNFQDLQEGDIVECYTVEKVAASL